MQMVHNGVRIGEIRILIIFPVKFFPYKSAAYRMGRGGRKFAKYRTPCNFSGAWICKDLGTSPVIVFISSRAQLYSHAVKMAGGLIFRKRDFADDFFGAFSVKEKNRTIFSWGETAEMYAVVLNRGSQPIIFV